MEESDEPSDFSRRAKGGIGMWQDEEEEEWRSEVGESYYLDMLRDVSRNQSYRDGLRRGILQMKQLKSDSVAVLDIGTGSGLLAMMAKQEGASTDTELLGEGVLPTLRHALRSLSEPECMVIPSHADIICFPIETVELAPGTLACVDSGTFFCSCIFKVTIRILFILRAEIKCFPWKRIRRLRTPSSAL
eukprot:765226-Hanusia_phi.AAC.3